MPAPPSGQPSRSESESGSPAQAANQTDRDAGDREVLPSRPGNSRPGNADESIDRSHFEPVRQYSGQAFRIAAHDGDLRIVRQAIASGITIDVADPGQGYTALLMAAYNGHDDVVKLLLHHDAEVDARDRSGKTPLIHACSGPFEKSVALLIQAGADVNVAESTEGFTPLMTAAALGQAEIVKLLLESGADRTATDRDGDTALSHARHAGHDQIVDMLR